jgi:hypothetical protein
MWSSEEHLYVHFSSIFLEFQVSGRQKIFLFITKRLSQPILLTNINIFPFTNIYTFFSEAIIYSIFTGKYLICLTILYYSRTPHWDSLQRKGSSLVDPESLNPDPAFRVTPIRIKVFDDQKLRFKKIAEIF